jgi:hypothetical protein
LGQSNANRESIASTIGFGQTQGNPWTNISESREAAAIVLTGDLVEKDLIEIHQNCKVDFSKKKPALVPK